MGLSRSLVDVEMKRASQRDGTSRRVLFPLDGNPRGLCLSQPGQTQRRNLFPAGLKECFLLVVSDFKSCPS